MKLYGGIDLHSNNSMVVLINEEDRVIYEKRLSNDLGEILGELSSYQKELEGIVVESTYNWYWLVDGLMDRGYRVHLANTTAIQQYQGLKYTDDRSDARWLAHLLRLGVLPEGYIYPKAERGVRDLLRKRSYLVRQKTSQVLSVQSLLSRYTGKRWSGNTVKKLKEEEVEEFFSEPEQRLAVQSHLPILRVMEEALKKIEKAVERKVKPRPEFQRLQTISGIGKILAFTILLEVGEMGRFKKVGQFVSYCRCVNSEKISNGKRKGKGNVKSGNKYLGWAWIEAANFAIRYDATIRKYYQKKASKTNRIVALKVVAHKLARAGYYILRDQESFDRERAFGSGDRRNQARAGNL